MAEKHHIATNQPDLSVNDKAMQPTEDSTTHTSSTSNQAEANMPFLKKVVDDITLPNNDLTLLKDHCYVFPTRRAGIYFKKYLTRRFKGQFIWSPHVFSIVEFTEHVTDKIILDPITLVFELFKVYQLHEPQVKFDEFYAWGQLILKDFDELDKYMVDADNLFSNLKDLREVEELFTLPEEQFQFLQQFWNVIDTGESTELQQEFVRIWQVLGRVYKNFRAELIESGAAYEGMVQREIVEQLEGGQLQLPFTRIVFAGFNALGKAEERMVDHLAAHYNFTIYWDTDSYYLFDEKQESGKFVRRYHQRFKDSEAHNWESQTDLATATKKIHTIGVPLKVGQAKYAGQLLDQLLTNEELKIQESVIVLGDESLLFPTLYALPENVEYINITMGYPLKDNPLYQLMESIKNLQKQVKVAETKKEQNDTDKPKQAKKVSFSTKYVLQILNNPFVKAYNPEGVDTYRAYIERNNFFYVNDIALRKRLPEPIFQLIFRPVTAASFIALIDLYNDLLVMLFSAIKQKYGIAETDADLNNKTHETEEDTSPKVVELEFVYHMLKQLQKLKDTLHKYHSVINIETFWKLFREVIQSVKLPFTGEPLQGLQIMGFLESRTLDFKNVFVLGMNEGAIPASKPHQTFIPFNLRKGFGMPTFLDQDAIFAYHFYHLLQRAENIYLTYNTEVSSGFGAGEKSRFLLQLEQELEQVNPNIEFVHKLVTAPMPPQVQDEQLIEVPKTPPIMQKLQMYVADAKLEAGQRHKKLSPSALTTYIQDTLQFYFRYLAELKETQELDEEINAKIFGTIVHKTMELLYINALYQKLTETQSITRDTIRQVLGAPYPLKKHLQGVCEKYQIMEEDIDLDTLVSASNSWMMLRLTTDFDKSLVAKRNEQEKVLDASLKSSGISSLALQKSTLVKHGKVRLIHKMLGQGIKEALLEKSDIDQVRNNDAWLEQTLRQAFDEERFDNYKTGKNLLLKNIIKKLILKILEQDSADAPIRMVGLEATEYGTTLDIGEGRNISVSGTIDRLDQIFLPDGTAVYRILDYKTGKVQINDGATAMKPTTTMDTYFSKYFSDVQYKVGFQAYLYAWLFWQKNKGAPIKIGIYALKSMNKGIRYLRKGEFISDAFFETFEQHLKELLKELYNKDIPFKQGEKEEAYQYSPYKDLVEK